MEDFSVVIMKRLRSNWFENQMLKRPPSQERYKILLMLYFLMYRNLLEFITFVQSYFHSNSEFCETEEELD
jgi:hypothetical protein